MTEAFVSVGSNVERVAHIRTAVCELRGQFEAVALSSVYESEAVGFIGDPFLNLVAAFETKLGLDELLQALRRIESAGGRDRSAPRYSSRTLDLDLLLFGELVIKRAGLQLPRSDVTTQAFVLGPLREVAPDRRHPVDGRSYSQLWTALDQADAIWKVDFDLGQL